MKKKKQFYSLEDSIYTNQTNSLFTSHLHKQLYNLKRSLFFYFTLFFFSFSFFLSSPLLVNPFSSLFTHTGILVVNVCVLYVLKLTVKHMTFNSQF